MCNLTKLTFTCGHTHLTLTTPCSSSTPSFCRAEHGLEITHHTTSLHPCRPSCPRAAALSTLARQHARAAAAIPPLLARAANVEACLPKIDAGYFTTKRFAKLEEEGWDAEKLVELCRISLGEVRNLLSEVPGAKVGAEEDLVDAYAAAKASVNHYLIKDAEGEREVVAFDPAPLVELGVGGRLYGVVCELERRASQACFEAVGWEGPGVEEDEVQWGVLWGMGAWKRGRVSGSWMDGAFVGKKKRVVYTA